MRRADRLDLPRRGYGWRWDERTEPIHPSGAASVFLCFQLSTPTWAARSQGGWRWDGRTDRGYLKFPLLVMGNCDTHIWVGNRAGGTRGRPDPIPGRVHQLPFVFKRQAEVPLLGSEAGLAGLTDDTGGGGNLAWNSKGKLTSPCMWWSPSVWEGHVWAATRFSKASDFQGKADPMKVPGGAHVFVVLPFKIHHAVGLAS